MHLASCNPGEPSSALSYLQQRGRRLQGSQTKISVVPVAELCGSSSLGQD